MKGTGCLTLTYEAGSYYLQKIPTVMLWQSAFRSILTYLNLMAIVAIWLAGQYPTGSFSESLKHWTPEFLPSAWGNVCFACQGSLKTWLRISAPESFCLEVLHKFLMIVFVFFQ